MLSIFILELPLLHEHLLLNTIKWRIVAAKIIFVLWHFSIAKIDINNYLEHSLDTNAKKANKSQHKRKLEDIENPLNQTNYTNWRYAKGDSVREKYNYKVVYKYNKVNKNDDTHKSESLMVPSNYDNGIDTPNVERRLETISENLKIFYSATRQHLLWNC